MNVFRWIFFTALMSAGVFSNDQNSCEKFSQGCETYKQSAPLGFPVLLPCDLKTENTTQVSWSHSPEDELVLLTSDGHIRFLDPRQGRVKAFPNLALKGNFSIGIDYLEDSDLGCYLCQWENGCLQVDLVSNRGTQSKGTQQQMYLYIVIPVAVAGILLHAIGLYLCIKYGCKKTSQESTGTSECTNGNNASAETGRVPEGEHQTGPYNDGAVYENDDQDPANKRSDQSRPDSNPDTIQAGQSSSGIYPNLNEFNFVSMESQSKRLRFHSELFSRLRQASVGRHYYVNQVEISAQHAKQAEDQKRAGYGRKRTKENQEYKNPIYNGGTEQLGQR